MYNNEGTGLEKIGHERIYGGRGRKHVKEHMNGQTNEYDHYKGISHSNAHDFDREWDDAARKMGFYSNSNAIPFKAHTHNFGRDDNRRGHYVPNSLKAPGAPVRFREEDERSIGPTDPNPRGALELTNGERGRGRPRPTQSTSVNQRGHRARGRPARIG